MDHWQVFQGAMLVLIAAIGAFIAYGNYKNAAVKLQLDLFDRRYKVFEAAKKLLATMTRDGDVNITELLEFNFAVAESDFMFGPDVSDYIDELRKKAGALHVAGKRMRADTPDARRQGSEEATAIMDWVGTQYIWLRDVFRPYLRLDTHSLSRKRRYWLGKSRPPKAEPSKASRSPG